MKIMNYERDMTLDSFCNPFNILYIPESLLSDILLEGIVTGWWVECVIQCRISILMEEVPILFQELRLFIKGVLLGYIILSWTAPPSPSSPQKCDDRGKFLQRRGKKEIEIARLNGRRQVLYTLSRRPILLFFVPLPVAADKEVNLCVKCQFLRFIENEKRGYKIHFTLGNGERGWERERE